MTRQEKAKKISELLTKEFPHVQVSLNHSNALELLIATILSAQCTDKRVNETTAVLFKKYKMINNYANANLAEFVDDIRSISLRNNKAKNIISLSKIIIEKYNGEIPDSLNALIELPGVGRKTANIVLGEWFKKPNGFVVDTHVKRCAYRMGLTDSKDVKIIEKDLMNIFPKEQWIEMGSRIIFHGRTTCPASRKVNEPCSLGDLCTIKT